MKTQTKVNVMCNTFNVMHCMEIFNVVTVRVTLYRYSMLCGRKCLHKGSENVTWQELTIPFLHEPNNMHYLLLYRKKSTFYSYNTYFCCLVYKSKKT